MSYNGNDSFGGVSKRQESRVSHSNKVRTSELKADVSDIKELTVTNGATVSSGLTVDNGLTVDSTNGSTLYRVTRGTVSVDPGSILTTVRGSVDVTISGGTGDRVFLQPPSGLNAGLVYVGCDFTATNTVTIYLYNKSGGTIDDSALTWKYTVFDFTS